MSALYHLAKADFLERVRRYSFLVTVAFAVYIGLAAARGQISLRLGDYIGVPNSAWVGGLMSLTTTVFLSLVGFFIVSTSVQRDQQTRVGRILAATPMSRFAYTLAKAISNFAVLSAMVAVLAIAGVATVLFGHNGSLEFVPLFAPFLFIALPTMALVAAIAVFFEATPILRRISAFAYFFLWIFALAQAINPHNFDPIGMQVISASMTKALKAIDPAYEHGISFGFIVGGAGRSATPKPFLWSGIAWTPALILEHLSLFPIAALVALVPALWFHRFDPAKEWIKRKSKSQKHAEAHELATAERSETHTTFRPAQLTVAGRKSSALAIFLSLVASEVRLLAARRSWWAYLIAAGLTIASFSVPLAEARHGLIVAIWIVPMLVWSRLGAREDLFATRALIFSAPRASLLPLAGAWIAGAMLPLVLASGVIVRLLATGDPAAAASLCIGAFFTVALAMAIGNLARTPKAFEAVYVVWWYIGPLQGIPGLDFVGVSRVSARPAAYAALTLLLILAAWLIREFRSQRS